jgi:hypothetical protein
MVIKSTPNIRKIFQMDITYTSLFQSKALKFFSQIGIFGLKANHLATLVVRPLFAFSSKPPAAQLSTMSAQPQKVGQIS